MSSSSTTSRRQAPVGTDWRSIILQLAVPLGFFVLVYSFVPLIDQFQVDMDEGIELMKALLYARGYALYSEIWSNQMPLFTMALAGVFRLFGEDVLVGRILVLAFSSLLLWSAFDILRTSWGPVHALAGTILIALSPIYVEPSVLAMGGLPAVCLALLSLNLLIYWHRGRGKLWLSLSALALSLSVLTKAFTAFLFPVFVVGILTVQILEGRKDLRSPAFWLPAILWSSVFAVAVLLLAFALVGSKHFNMLVSMHEIARNMKFYEEIGLQSHLEGGYWFLLLAVLAIPFAVSSRHWVSVYVVAWFATAFLVLSVHFPVWNHHMLLLFVPAAMLGGIGVGEAARALRIAGPPRDIFSVTPVLALLAVLTAGLTIATSIPRLYDEVHKDSWTAEDEAGARQLVDEIRRYAPSSRWIFTDHYQYAFRAGLPVPPGLASLSEMQLRTETLTEKEILDTIEAYDPEQILLARFDLPKIRSYAEDHYHLVDEHDGDLLFVRKDLSKEE